ncbi:MAG: DHHW family protein [Eubacteriales bacterium]|nr:DHHW family protein [Eubacteriales bacterium]
MRKRQNSLVIAGFMLMIFIPTAAGIVSPKRSFSERENRALAGLPAPNLSAVMDGSFSKNYETYLADQFFLRDGWIGLKTAAERGIGKQEINDIYFAKDGYLIEKHTGSFQTELAKNNLQYLAEFMEAQRAVYGETHAKAMIVPNAVQILSDKLPAFAENTEEDTYLSAVADALPPDSLIDTESVLEEHAGEEIYYRTDHHWKTLAARYVYEAWAEEIGLKIVPVEEYEIRTLTEDFRGTIEAKVNCNVKSDSIESYVPKKEVPYTLTYNKTETRDSLYDLSYLEGRDKYGVFFGGNQPLIEIKSEAVSERKLVVIKDSYANCFLPFAVQDFSEIAIIDIRYFNESLKEYLAGREFTDLLVLYNASGFAEDAAVAKLTT